MTDAFWKIPLADLVVTDEDLAAVIETYRSGWLSTGPRTEKLEREFAAYVGARHAVAVSSGTAALHLMCLAAGIGRGDDVVLPAMTFVATANAVRYTGARPVFADIAAIDRPWLDAETVEAALTPRTRSILYVAYGGHPGAVLAVSDIAAERGVMLLEDSAHALGATVDGRSAGTWGRVAAFSFFANKNLAVGEGGIVTTDDDAVAAGVRLLRSHGMTAPTWDRHRGHATDYDVVAAGFNYRLDEPRAALASSRLRRLTAENQRRAELVAAYREALDAAEGVRVIPTAAPPGSANHLLTVLLDESLDRTAIRQSLRTGGIQTSVHYPPVTTLALYSDAAAALPATEAYGARTMTLPLFPHMTDGQVEYVAASVRSACRQAARSAV